MASLNYGPAQREINRRQLRQQRVEAIIRTKENLVLQSGVPSAPLTPGLVNSGAQSLSPQLNAVSSNQAQMLEPQKRFREEQAKISQKVREGFKTLRNLNLATGEKSALPVRGNRGRNLLQEIKDGLKRR